MAVSDAVAEAADLEELEVVLGAVDLFSGRWLAAESVGERAEFSTLPTLAIFFPPGHGKTWERFRMRQVIRECVCACVGISDGLTGASEACNASPAVPKDNLPRYIIFFQFISRQKGPCENLAWT